MRVTTTIEAYIGTGRHHVECMKDHELITLSFISSTADGGNATADTRNCLLYEMEDSAEASVVEAIEHMDFVTVDEESLRDAAVVLAERADSLHPGDKLRVTSNVEVETY